MQAGDVVGRYRIEARIGGGGMGVVYRATDTTLGRAVALKFLAPELAGVGDARARFLREARAASALDHPHIGVIYEVGEHAGGAFIAMAFYDGETLKERIARGPMPIDEAERFTRQLAAALQAAHAAGIAHRDVKPANVMIARDGSVKLVDFGLAKLLDDATADALTAQGTIIGTLYYMAPEQLRGEAADARADLWALGVVAYEMLAGKSPFARADRAAVIGAILTEEPPAIDKLRADTPASLAALVHALLEKSAAQRIGSASEVISVLDQTSPSPRRRHRARRRQLAGLGALVVLVAGGVGAWQLWPRESDRARHEFQLGVREFELLHHDAALKHFEEAYRLTGDPALLFNVAQMYDQADKHAEAAMMFRRFLDASPNATPQMRAIIEKKLSRSGEPPRAAAPTPTSPSPSPAAAPAP